MAYQLLFLVKNIMKKILLITVSAVGLLIYLLFIKKRNNPAEHAEHDIKPNPGKHHLTNVFAKAKQYTANK